MTEKEILKRIKVILEHSSMGIAPLSRFYKSFNNFSNETVELLLALSQKLVTSKEKTFFWNTIGRSFYHRAPTKELNGPNKVYIIGIRLLIWTRIDFVFMLFIKSGKIDEVLDHLQDWEDLKFYGYNLLSAISSTLMYEPSIFNEKRLENLESVVKHFRTRVNAERTKKSRPTSGSERVVRAMIEASGGYVAPTITLKQYDELLPKIIKQISRINYQIYKSELKSVNLEINQDKKTVQVKIKDFGFNLDLNECLDKFDEDYQKATDEFDFKSCIGHVRTFLEKLSISIAEKIAEVTKIPPSEKLTGLGSARGYFSNTKIKFLTKQEDKFLNALYGIMSDSAVHSLKSPREYARIARNHAIEIGLFLLEKCDKYIGSKKILKEKSRK